MKGIITNIQPNGSFNSQYGELFNFLYTIDNVQYSMNHKTNASPFIVNTELEYEVTAQATAQYPAKIKKVQTEFAPQQGQFQKKASGSNRSFALSYAKDCWVGNVIKGAEMFDLADKMVAWLDNEPVAAPAPQPVAPPVQVEPDLLPEENKLPF